MCKFPAAGAGDNLVVISGLDPPPAAEDLLGFSFMVNKWVIKHVCKWWQVIYTNIRENNKNPSRNYHQTTENMWLQVTAIFYIRASTTTLSLVQKNLSKQSK